MKNTTEKKLAGWITTAGILLLLVPFAFLAYSEYQAKRTGEALSAAASGLSAMLPKHTAGVMDPEASDHDMPVYVYNGEDYIALLSVPSESRVLPVMASRQKQENTDKDCPYRFSGSVYNDTLMIGGTDASGQLDFVSRVDSGDRLTVTDMRGKEYYYSVSFVRHVQKADIEAWENEDADLVLFASAVYGTGFRVVLCDRVGGETASPEPEE